MDKLEIVQKKQEELEKYRNRSLRNSSSPNDFRSRRNSVLLTDEAVIVDEESQGSSTPTKVKLEPNGAIQMNTDYESNVSKNNSVNKSDTNDHDDIDGDDDDKAIM